MTRYLPPPTPGPECDTAQAETWTCPRCESDDRSGQPEHGCTSCGYNPEQP